MSIYIGATFLSMIFSYCAKHYLNYNNFNKNFIYKLLLLLSFLPLFIISAIRHNIGTDYVAIYRPEFDIILNKRGNWIHSEIGFIILNQIIILFTDNYIWLFVVTSFIFCFFIYNSIFDQSPNPYYSILLFLLTGAYLISFNAVRQCIAISIFLYSIKYIDRNCFIKYLLAILLASTIHKSILICIPVYFFNKINISPIKGLFIALLSIISLPFIKQIIIAIISYTKYKYYISSIYNTGNFEICYFLIHIGIIIYLYVFYKKYRNSKEYILFLNIELLSFILCIYSSFFPLASRLLWTFSFTHIIFIPKITRYLKGYERIFLNSVIIILYMIYMIYTFVILGNHEVLPYQTIWK